MVLDEEDRPDGKETPRKGKGFSYYPLLTYKRNLNKTFTTTSISYHILMTTED